MVAAVDSDSARADSSRADPARADPARELMLRRLPKISLHCHLIGSIQANTLFDLATKHGLPLLPGRTPENLFDHASYEDLGEFLRVLDIAGSVIRDVDDFRRVTYESLTDGGAAHNVLYREIMLSPPGHPGVAYSTIIEGVLAGMNEARVDTGIDSRMIVAINREDTAAAGEQLVQEVIDHRIDEVIGIGLDYAEVNGPPEKFWKAYRLAGAAGLERTAHSESGPPGNIETILDLLGCCRVDHGYHVVEDERILERCVSERIPFTCTPVSSDIGRYSGSGDGSHAKIAEMVDAGLCVTIDSDDPPMFGTDPTNDFRALSHALGYGIDELAGFTANALEACWLDESDKAALGTRISGEVDALRHEQETP
jgi:adenosine deaminase